MLKVFSMVRAVFWLIIFKLCVFKNSDANNILWLAGLASPSHEIWTSVLQGSLADIGHNITVLSVNENKKKSENVTFIQIEEVYEFYSRKKKNLKSMAFNGPIHDIVDIARYRSDSCIPAFYSQGVRTLMGYPKSFKFDLIIHDFAGSHCLLGFVPRFGNPPLVGVSASTCSVGISGVSGNPQYPSFIPSNHLPVGYFMNFVDRLYNTLIYICDNIVREFYMIPKENALARKYFEDKSLDVGLISRSSFLTLVNLSPLEVMQPFFQTVIPVGGMHIEKPKPLNKELNDFISKSEKGLVYFALGTNIKSEYFTRMQVDYFLEAFSRLPSYGFVWKYDPAQMSLVLPGNVMISEWLPQNDILAHPLTKGFIGHGGALSCHEALWYGVPQLLLPFIIDQKHNAARAQERGVALVLDKDNLSADIIYECLLQILENPSFRQNMAGLSRAFHDQPQSPLERAVYWIEYAIRHGNGSKLRSPGQDLRFFQQMGLDIIGVLLIIFVTVIFVMCFVIKIFMQRLKITIKLNEKND